MLTEYSINERDVGYVELEQAVGRQWMWNISAVVVDELYQGLGVGTALMKVVCKDADLEGVELWLVPQSIDGRQERLIEWYKGFGFDVMQGSGYMIRKPQTPT